MDSIKCIIKSIIYFYFSFVATTTIVTGIVYNLFFCEYINDGIKDLNKQLEIIEPLKKSEQVETMVIGRGIKMGRYVLAYYDLDRETSLKDIEDYLLKQGYKKNSDNKLYSKRYMIRLKHTDTPHRITVFISRNNYFTRNNM